MHAALAREVIARCRSLAACSDEPGFTTRTFLSPAMRAAHAQLSAWMKAAGMTVSVDAAGNLRGVLAAATAGARTLLIGSHLDTVPHAGAFDGPLGVVIGVALVEQLQGRRLPFNIEVVAFSEEEGVRFGVPFIGSRALVGDVDAKLLETRDASGVSIAEAIRDFGLDPSGVATAAVTPRLRSGQASAPLGYLEFHIEQGPVLHASGKPLAVVDRISGRTAADVAFVGVAGHAGTTPMDARRDAVAGAAVWLRDVEEYARRVPGLVATTGQIVVTPGAANVIAERCRISLDVRHGEDATRTSAVDHLEARAREIARRRQLSLEWSTRLDQPTTPMDARLVAMLKHSVTRAGAPVETMPSGAGHDAMIVAPHMPAAMLFLRTPGGLSHHPDETVLDDDVALALAAGGHFLDELAASIDA